MEKHASSADLLCLILFEGWEFKILSEVYTFPMGGGGGGGCQCNNQIINYYFRIRNHEFRIGNDRKKS